MRLATRERRGARLWCDAELAEAVFALELDDPDTFTRQMFGAAGARGRAATALLPLPGGARLQLRAVRHGGLLGPLWGDRLLGLGRPLRELAANASLRERGAPVPRPVLVVGVRRGPLWAAALGTLHEPDTRDGLALLADAPPPRALAAAAAAAARAVRRFHDAGGRHADLHLGNLLFRAQGAGFEALVIDLDRAEVGAAPDAARRMRELMRLYRSLCKRGAPERVRARIGARFLAVYCAGDRALRRALLVQLPGELRRLARHERAWRR